MSHNKVYTVGRLCAVATRPLCLFIANNYLAPRTAQDLALTFLATALVMMAIAADPHRHFYSRQFASARTQTGLPFYLYVFSVLLLLGVGSATMFAGILQFGGAATLAAISVLYLISEKLADEVLRFRLFERNFDMWGRATVARSLLQLTGLVAIMVWLGGATPGWLTVLVLSLGNLVVFVPSIPASLRRAVRHGQYAIAFHLFGRATAALTRNWRLWATAVLGSGIVYVDRVVALLVDTAMLPLFMLVVMAFSVVQMAVDFYYVSTHRREFLRGEVSVGGALSSPGFVGSFAAGLLLALVICALILVFSRNGDSFPLWYVVVVAVLQCSIAASAIPQQIIYWGRHFNWILRVESVFWLVFGLAATLAWWLGGDRDRALPIVAMCATLRLALYAVLALRVTATRPAADHAS